MPQGPKVCAKCGSRSHVVPDHINGVPDDTRRGNLQWLCKSCNTAKGIAFRNAGKGRLTRQYNPGSKQAPTFQQYAWAVANHARGAHDEGGAIIHATPLNLRREYAGQIWDARRERGTDSSMPDWAKNPGAPGAAFKRCVRDVEAKGGADDPKAVCAAAGRKKYGKAEFQRMAAAGRKRAARNPSEGNWYAFDRAFRVRKQAWDYARKMAQQQGYSVTISKREDADSSWQPVGRVWPDGRTKSNPADASAEVFEEFHGFEPSEVITVERLVHHHEHLASAGKFEGFVVRPVGGGKDRALHIPGEAYLAFNERKNQLFVEGGDQFLDEAALKQFGITEIHELETLGQIVAVAYHTRKDHLEAKDGGEAIYSHTFRTTNKAGRHVVVKMTRPPDLIYRVLDQQFEISGGSYEIRAEGIDK